jgi:hypothetical protein
VVRPIIHADSDVWDSDWIKTLCWDLPTDPETFLAFLVGRDASPEQQRAAVADFLRLPAARAMPAAAPG